MSLTVPITVGPLSELTSPYGIRVTGQLVNANVTIYTRTPARPLIAQGQASSGDQRFMLLPGVSLKSDMQLFAM